MFALRPKAAVLAGAAAIALSLFSPGKSAHACPVKPIIGSLCLLASTSPLPQGYLYAQGQVLKISDYRNLHDVIGCIYGGKCQENTFALPDMRGRAPVGQGKGPYLNEYIIGERGGSETATQTVNTMAAHTHGATATAHAQSAVAATTVPGNNVWADARNDAYSTAAPNADMLAGAVTVTIATTGGGQPMLNMQPYLTLNWIIAYQGNFAW